ncbi:chemokine XC receptor 1-like isoform X2 [Clarias gariepinus]|nr:chemokine XC receptor 1-like isoform X2 [Clarias gariepinus]XP_053337743.1 chemokine XC receptor 1-like isoform X2 [Clarias gariepinus]XP_053337744.1 chemokine XC receptor 1-like isoform X2 [Clarias gariepinus]
METPSIFFHFPYVSNNSFKYIKQNEEGSTPEDGHTELSIILSIMILLGLIGNIFVVIKVSSMRLRSLTIIFILNLTLSDMLFTAGLMFRVYEHIWGLIPRDAGCKGFNYIFTAGFYCSIMFLVLMIVQRYMALVHPDLGWNKGLCTRRALFGALIGSTLAALPVVVNTAALSYSEVCMRSSQSAFVAIMYEYNIFFLCGFLVMDFCYIRIFQILFNSLTNQKHRIVGLAFFLLSTFLIFWAPHILMTFLYILAYHLIWISAHNLFYYVKYICFILAITRCFLIPVGYGLFGVKFREEMNEIFQITEAEQNPKEEFPSDNP